MPSSKCGRVQFPSEIERRKISGSAIRWFRKYQRDLPFRHTTDPYAILVSEIMLQQTQVATAVSYYLRFLQQFPNVSALADAREEDVLAAWAGLGYYRRARLLQAAAQQVMHLHDGRFPEDLDELNALPGVGRYTAGALYSFAFNKSAPIVEANTARLLARLFAFQGTLKELQSRLWVAAEQLLPSRNPREHNYALMELGALVCTPTPRCEHCPLSEWCLAYKMGQTNSIPEPSIKPEKLQRAFAGVVVQCGTKYLLRRIPEGEWHHGLYEFPAVPVPVSAAQSEQLDLVSDFVRPACSLVEPAYFAEFRYTVTRHAVRLSVFKAEAESSRRIPPPFYWKSLDEIETLPLGSAQRKLLDLLKKQDDIFACL